jgi:hypothetical protein
LIDKQGADHASSGNDDIGCVDAGEHGGGR